MEEMSTESQLSTDYAIADLISQFQADCELRGMASTDDYVRCAREFASFVSERGRDVLNIHKEDLKAFLIKMKEKKLKQRTIDRKLVCLSTFYTFLIDEEHLTSNPILPFRRRYLKNIDTKNDGEIRQIISVSDASRLVNSILDTRDRAIVVLLLKTGLRRTELTRLDIADIDLEKGELRLKPTGKRSNRQLFIDEEAIRVMGKWLQVRKTRKGADSSAVFISRKATRLCPDQIEILIEKHASRVGLHNPQSERLEEHFGPHCCRHWFTTHLIRAGMPRDFVKELRGDSRHEAIDIYNHIDKKELRESYLAHIPQLGI